MENYRTTTELKPYKGVRILRTHNNGLFYYEACADGEFFTDCNLQALKRKIKKYLDEKDTKGFYVGTLYRFGYDLTCAGCTEEEVRDAIMKEYCDAYVKMNGCSPMEDTFDGMFYGDEEKTYYDNAMEDIEIQFYEIGKVNWR